MNTQEILEHVLLPQGSPWRVKAVEVDESQASIYVDLEYAEAAVLVDGQYYAIYDRRKIRTWRHLDLWQYKTYLRARIPRYKKGDKVMSVEVPWAEVSERMTELFEKKR